MAGNEVTADAEDGQLIEAILATTDVVHKYGAERLTIQALEQLRDALLSGGIPFRFDHDAGHPLDVQVVDAALRPRGDGEYDLTATLSVLLKDWGTVQAAFDASGVRGGFSYSRSEFENIVGPAEAIEREDPPVVSLVADAGAFTVEDRADASLAVAQKLGGVVEIRRGYAYSADPDTIQVVLEYAKTIGLGALGSAAWAGVEVLLRRHTGRTRIELKRQGDQHSATVTTSDAQVALAALEQLPEVAESLGTTPAVYDSGSAEWQWPARRLDRKR